MSLFQCGGCGCIENTALTRGYLTFSHKFLNFKGKEHLKGRRLCSACTPATYLKGTGTGMGTWHGEFKQNFLPKGKYTTDRVGNLVSIADPDQDYTAFIRDSEYPEPSGDENLT